MSRETAASTGRRACGSGCGHGHGGSCCGHGSPDPEGSLPVEVAIGDGAPPYFCAACQREYRRLELHCERQRDSLEDEPVAIETLSCPGCGAVLAVDLDFVGA